MIEYSGKKGKKSKGRDEKKHKENREKIVTIMVNLNKLYLTYKHQTTPKSN